MKHPRWPRPVSIVISAVVVIALLMLIVAQWVRVIRSFRSGGSGPVWLTAAVIIVIVLAAMWLASLRTRTRHRAVRAARQGWSTYEVVASDTLAGQLVIQGVWERSINPLGGTGYTLAWSSSGLELWRGWRQPSVVVAVPWPAVASVTVGAARSGLRDRHGIVISTVAGASLVVIPRVKPTGGIPAYDSRCAADLVAAIRETRGAL